MKKFLTLFAVWVVLFSCAGTDKGGDNGPLVFDELSLDMDKMTSVEKTLVFYDGAVVNYRAYEKIYYVKNVADPAYHYLNMYIPESAYTGNGETSIFLWNTVGGYMASRYQEPTVADVAGRALREGFIVVIPGVRGWNSMVDQAGEPVAVPLGSPAPEGAVYTGRAPAAIVDLKAAVRFLRHNDAVMPGSAERIISDGTSAGGALSALLGASGNNPAYEPYLRALGAAEERDDIFAAICYCPIIDLEHADMAYEWLYRGTNAQARSLQPGETAVSNELAALYPAYLDSLGLRMSDGTAVSSANYMTYLKAFLLNSAQTARNADFDIPGETGVILNKNFQGTPGELVLDIDMDKYLNYVVVRTPLKTPPAFDQFGVLNQGPSAENRLFGGEKGDSANFTTYSAEKSNSSVIDEALQSRVDLMNPMNFIGDGVSRVAKNWYLRHGSVDRDTAFQIPINLYTKLNNFGYDVDFRLTWNRGHQGDYDLDDLFMWIKKIVKAAAETKNL
ncbi:MAG: alpha/beta hydrolase [Treponema sp.]|nr:alpha/beta hydrolase [Treponema sp.]